MRTLKTLAAFGVLLLIASSANAGIIFTLHAATPDDGDPDINVELDIELTGGTTLGTMGLDWLYGANVPVGPAPAINVLAGCPVAANQMGCAFDNTDFIGAAGGNTIGDNWTWDGATANPGPFEGIGLFTLAAGSTGQVTVGNFEIFDTNFATITDITVIPYNIVPIPEPGTVALLGLGLAGLGLAGRRKA